jgi:DNA (cytosine-5)-methyltransferase 1
VLTAIDLYCGAGGLTEGLKQAGFSVIGAVDIAPLAIEAFESNHPETVVWRRDVRGLAPDELMDQLKISPGDLDLLAGCPPCQGFSSMRTHRQGTHVEDRRNALVAQFARFAEALKPRALMMENVPALREDRRLKLMLARLRKQGYELNYDVLDAANYGVPQRRRRFVLIALRGGTVAFAPPDRATATVRDALKNLPKAGKSADPLHDHGEQRSEPIRKLIQEIPKDGGSRHDLGEEKQLPCHRRLSGWYDVYGRMSWEKLAPTITGGCINPSKGRFLHPTENRAITLREAALLQSFPPDYKFPLSRGKYRAADLIGNALPPRFVAAQASQIAAALKSI